MKGSTIHHIVLLHSANGRAKYVLNIVKGRLFTTDRVEEAFHFKGWSHANTEMGRVYDEHMAGVLRQEITEIK